MNIGFEDVLENVLTDNGLIWKQILTMLLTTWNVQKDYHLISYIENIEIDHN